MMVPYLLFRGIKINTIAVDYANNIWMGSDNGLFVFNNKKNKILYHFNKTVHHFYQIQLHH